MAHRTAQFHSVPLFRAALAAALLLLWEFVGRVTESTWTSAPSRIALRLIALARESLALDVATTLWEIIVGLAIGVPAGVIVGLALGRSPIAASLFRPIIAAFNSIPVIALMPLLIMWFGLGIAPKAALVALVTFFLIFFNAFAGAQAVDRDWISSLRLMGATRFELFRIIVLPSCVAWILTGLKSALPYSLIAATVGEMMLSRAGMGHVITAAAAQFDMPGLYAGLIVLMLLGSFLNGLATRLKSWLLRWRAV